MKGTGKFLNYSPIPRPNWNGEFKHTNLIYGENGSGKTTIALMLRSLQGDNVLLSKKRTFDRTVPQKIEILTDISPDPKLIFEHDSWNRFYPEIEIFDIHFVNDNIYAGLEIQPSHKKHLLEVIFGQRGILLKKEIQEIKERIQKGNRYINDTAEKIKIAIESTFDADAFCRLPIDSDIDKKIENKEIEIVTAKSFQDIQSTNSLSLIPRLSEPVSKETATAVLGKSTDTISFTYLQKFRKHKERLGMDGKAEMWIKQGYEAIQDEKCPFCLRPLDASVEIMEAYKQYFNEEYNNLISLVTVCKASMNAFNIEALLLSLENKVSANQTLVLFWKKHIPNAPSFNNIIEDEEELLASYALAKTTFEQKSLNPIASQNDSGVMEFLRKIEMVNSRIEELNIVINDYNRSIAVLKSKSSTNVAQLESDLKKLRAIKKRSDNTVSLLCKNYSTYTQAVRQFNLNKEKKQDELHRYSTTIFSRYSTKINQYLKAFAPYLEVRNLDSGYVGSSKEPMTKFALYINGNEIKQADDPIHPTFKYSFSEGDKGALALAFFLTKLEVEGNLENKIIVFDDPVSSFDLNRKATTISKLLHFGEQANQLFVLTHNIVFAGEFWRETNQATSQCLKIEWLHPSSVLVDFDINMETLASVIKDSLLMQDFVTNGTIDAEKKIATARAIRPALESYFHLKFFDLVSDDDWLGDFIKCVRNCTPSDPFDRLRPQLQELIEINDYSKRFHHRYNTSADGEPINDTQLRAFCQRTLDLIQLI